MPVSDHIRCLAAWDPEKEIGWDRALMTVGREPPLAISGGVGVVVGPGLEARDTLYPFTVLPGAIHLMHNRGNGAGATDATFGMTKGFTGSFNCNCLKLLPGALY